MLKWISQQKGKNPRSASPSNKIPANSIHDTNTTRWLTDDPLATINTCVLDTKRRQSQPEPVYSVTRMNPLFVDSPNLAKIRLMDGEKRLLDDSRSSNRSDQCQTPSSSGYESADPRLSNSKSTSNHHTKQQQHQPVHRQHLVELSPASDYRRQFVLGLPRLDRSSPRNITPDGVARRIGKANLLQQNPHYVTRIQMSSSDKKIAAVNDEWDKYEEQQSGDILNKVPHPVWPAENGQQHTNASAIVQQNENYVTKIVIAAPTVEREEQDTLDSIVTHSLLVMTSYDDQSIVHDPTADEKTERIVVTPSAAELSEIGQLSQSISQSRVVATVSRALSKSSETTNKSSSFSSSSSSSVGGSIARRISMMKERWDKSSHRRLLTESDEEDTGINRRLVYVPQNGDVNFSMATRNGDSMAPFSYLAGVYHPSTINEEMVTENQVRPVMNRNPFDPFFEQDRLSNSSSRSSGSRRVTFSADTVDNEQSTKSTNSIASSGSGASVTSSNRCANILEELKLNPHYLPHRYQPSVNSDVVGSSRLAGYYSYNLQAQLDNYNAKGQGEKVSTWEHYHQQDIGSSNKEGPSTSRPSSSSAARLDPYNNLQLHPNYGAACQERSICVDFTLDGAEEALLQRRSDSHKLRRRICCCFLLLLCLVVLVIVVIVISLYLSQGQRIFGSLGPM